MPLHLTLRVPPLTPLKSVDPHACLGHVWLSGNERIWLIGELEDLGAALARTVSALERVRLGAREPGDRDRLRKALVEARAALAKYRLAVRGEPGTTG